MRSVAGIVASGHTAVQAMKHGAIYTCFRSIGVKLGSNGGQMVFALLAMRRRPIFHLLRVGGQKLCERARARARDRGFSLRACVRSFLRARAWALRACV